MGWLSHKKSFTKNISPQTNIFNTNTSHSHSTGGGFTYNLGGLMNHELLDKPKNKPFGRVKIVRPHSVGKCSTVANGVRDRVYIKCSCGAFTIIELPRGKK